jgi:3-oxoadipate enol-lactonase/4-carboxymuconolactone decarboxylase
LRSIIPEALTGLIACATGDKLGTAQTWDERIAEVRADGTRGLVDDTADRWFAAGFLEEDIAAGPLVLADLALVDDEAYIAAATAAKSYDLSGSVRAITVPTLFLAGAQDPGFSPEAMSSLAERVDGAQSATVPDSAHLPMVEHPELVADRIHGFCSGALTTSPPEHLTIFSTGGDLLPSRRTADHFCSRRARPLQ